jgi:hypothetical protein
MAGAAERYAAGDAVTGAKLTAEQRANTLAAHELAAKEAKARGAHKALPADLKEWFPDA